MKYAKETDYKLLIRNLFEYKWFVAVTVALLALALTVAGYLAPKKYESYSTILIEGETIIAPLLKGAAVSSNTSDWGAVADEIVNSRRTMGKLMAELGMVEDGIKTQGDEANYERLKRNTRVTLSNEKHLQIAFTDADPHFAKMVATSLTSLFIEETHGLRSAESEEAFDFIDSQVKEYHQKLLSAEERLKEFQIQKLETGASSQDSINSRLNRLQNTLDASELELRESVIQEQSLQRQLSGEVQETVSLSRQSQYFGRLQDLEDQLSTLRLMYHETYPDIVNVKGQIADLRRIIRQEKSNQVSGDSVMDQSYKTNKVYQGLKMQLGDVQTRIATLRERIRDTEQSLGEERRKGEVVHSSEAVLAELTRDYKVNKELYEDLLRRREAARVSKEIDESQQGLNIKVVEAAFLPLRPAGLRFIHFAAAGLMLGLMAPIGMLYAYQLVDSRTKSPESLQERLGGVPVLGLIPKIQNEPEVSASRASAAKVKLFYLLTIVSMAVIGYLKLTQSN